MYTTFINSYPKLIEKDGVKVIKLNAKNEPIIVFKYRVHGTKEELAALAKANTDKGINNVTDEAGTLYFSPVYVGEKATLDISTKGNVFVDTSLIDAAKSLLQQHGKVGELLAMQLLKDGFSSPREKTGMVEPVPTGPEIGD